jgi:lysyl-tRNA synthetase, class II
MNEILKSQAMDYSIGPDDIDSIRQQRLLFMRERGFDFPNDFRPSISIAEINAKYGSIAKIENTSAGDEVKVAGRVVARRVMGKTSFLDIQDIDGKLQISVSADATKKYHEFIEDLDIGDIAGFNGSVFRTRTGALTVRAAEAHVIVKSLHPLPDKFHGLNDPDIKYRHRYLDLIATSQSRDTFLARAKILRAIREFFFDRNFVEVETPIMQALAGGASAKPFTTHHNALDIQLYLRVAPELYLKRLLVGGINKVFEIGRNFRNEGLSTRHNPEFTSLEFYWAYADYLDAMEVTEELIREICRKIHGAETITYGSDLIDFAKPFSRFTVPESICAFNPEINLNMISNLDGAREVARKLAVPVQDHWGLGAVHMAIFDSHVESKLIQPTFICEYPTEVSPLARRNAKNPEVTDRCELFVGGRELANGFSELNDAVDQAKRFLDQAKQKANGDEEAMFYDEEFVTALEYGMPPAAGMGIGIDRLVMLLCDRSAIRDVILFPMLRPKE